jgi:hypothetical protein
MHPPRRGFVPTGFLFTGPRQSIWTYSRHSRTNALKVLPTWSVTLVFASRTVSDGYWSQIRQTRIDTRPEPFGRIFLNVGE